jgi:hypothetical protein
MKRYARCALLVLAGCLAAGCASLPPVGNPVAAPDLRVGDTWAYTVYDGFRGYEKGQVAFRVTAADADSTTMATTRGGQTEQVRYAAGWNPRAGLTPSGYQVSYQPALPLFRFPLADGARWTATVTAVNALTGERFPVQVRARVRGREKVQTPAGEFDAVVIERELIYGDKTLWRSDSYRVETEWFAPAVGASVRYRQDLHYYINPMSGGGGGDGGGGWVQVDYDREQLELRAFSRAPR